MKTRVRAIIINKSSTLLIHRLKEGEDYYVFPGGGVEDGETDEAALERELKEELGVDVSVNHQFATHMLYPEGKNPESEVFYFCSIISGELGTGKGPEFQQGTSYKGTYTLEWISFTEVEKSRILPEIIKLKLLGVVAQL